jgi:hypothetical protein
MVIGLRCGSAGGGTCGCRRGGRARRRRSWVPARVALSAHGFVSGKNRANDGVGCPLSSRCRLVVFPGETAAVESLFWAERTGLYVALATQTPVLTSPHPGRTGLYVALATQTPVLTSPHPGRTGLYVAPATQQPVLSTTHADNPSHDGTQLHRRRAVSLWGETAPTTKLGDLLGRRRRRAFCSWGKPAPTTKLGDLSARIVGFRSSLVRQTLWKACFGRNEPACT